MRRCRDCGGANVHRKVAAVRTISYKTSTNSSTKTPRKGYTPQVNTLSLLGQILYDVHRNEKASMNFFIHLRELSFFNAVTTRLSSPIILQRGHLFPYTFKSSSKYQSCFLRPRLNRFQTLAPTFR